MVWRNKTDRGSIKIIRTAYYNPWQFQAAARTKGYPLTYGCDKYGEGYYNRYVPHTMAAMNKGQEQWLFKDGES